MDIRSMTEDEIYNKAPLALVNNDKEFTINAIKNILNRLPYKLNNDQLWALLCATNKRTIIDSCAGSGKTTLAILSIILDLYVYNIEGMHILNFTFSKRGAMDIVDRYKSLCITLNVECKPILLGTMHSFYYGILQKYANRIGYTVINDESVIDDDSEALSMLADCCKDFVGNVNTTFLKDLYSCINYTKDALIYGIQEEIQALPMFKNLDIDYNKYNNIITTFDNYKKIKNKIDFSDMQSLFYRLLIENDDIATSQFREWYHRVILDEVQDTSKIQLKILELIVSDNCKLLCIGDKDQSIYAWRGAYPKVFDDLLVYYKDAIVATIGYNMRCPNNIVKIAESLLSYNGHRNNKNMVGLPKDGNILCRGFDNKIQCAKYIGGQISKLYKTTTDQKALSDVAVIYRNNIDAMFIVDYLLENEPDIPFSIRSGKLPFDDKIIKDIIDIYYMFSNPTNAELASKHLKKICASITNKMTNQIKQAVSTNVPIYKLILNTKRSFEPDRHFLEKMCKYVERVPTLRDFANKIMDRYLNNYYNYYASTCYVDESHINDVKLYIDYAGRNINVLDFGTKMIRYQQKLKEYAKLNIGINLNTMHGVKGLEFGTVFYLYASAQSCPNEAFYKDLSKASAITYIIEELNVTYVTLTRAKKNLIVTYNRECPSVFNVLSHLIEDDDYEKYLDKNEGKDCLYTHLLTGLLKSNVEVKNQLIDMTDSNNIMNELNDNSILSVLNEVANVELSASHQDYLNRLFKSR